MRVRGLYRHAQVIPTEEMESDDRQGHPLRSGWRWWVR